MYLPDEKFILLRDVIQKVYSRPFDENLLFQVAQNVCSLMDSDYFAFCLIGTNTHARPLFISNNPPEFIPVYTSVVQEDFLLEHIVSSHTEYVLNRNPGKYQEENKNFIRAVQSSRPISDVVYRPLQRNAILNGYWALARAGLDSPTFSDNQLKIFRYIVSFLDDAFTRSLLPPPQETDVALLDFDGVIVSCGARIQEVFTELFCCESINIIPAVINEQRRIFDNHYRSYISNPFAPGNDQLILHGREQHYSFRYSLLRPEGLELRYANLPYAAIRLIDIVEYKRIQEQVDPLYLSSRYGLTPRECQIVQGIYKGQSNKVIAQICGVEESTVKRHTHNIYEKTGFRSRVELVLGLFAPH